MVSQVSGKRNDCDTVARKIQNRLPIKLEEGTHIKTEQ